MGNEKNDNKSSPFSLQLYQGREQTYVKHLLLKNYLQLLAIKILSTYDEFVYVDGFSGPWEDADEGHEDTSIVIALKELRKAREVWKEKEAIVKCVFVEKNPEAFKKLQKITAEYNDIEILTIKGEFEESVPKIIKFIGRAYSFIFIDPTNWNVDIEKIKPLLGLKNNEVLFNFMYDHVNRFKDSSNKDLYESFNKIFTNPNWREGLNYDIKRWQNPVIELFREILKKSGSYKFAAYTPVLFPQSNRPFYYLIFGTSHLAGLVVFRDVQKKTQAEEDRARQFVKQENKIEKTKQSELFSISDAPIINTPQIFSKDWQVKEAYDLVISSLEDRGRILYDDLLSLILESFNLTETELKSLLSHLKKEKKVIDFSGLSKKERTPKRDKNHYILYVGPKNL